jgi:CHRD domain
MGKTMLVAATVAIGCALLLGAGLASGGSGKPRADASALRDRAFFAVLRGQNEPDGGDNNGRGSASVTFDGTSLCWGITVGNLDMPIAAHIHRGRSGQNGTIVVPLEQPAAGDPGASSGCTTVTAALARAIRRNPRRYYVNVHTTEYAGGAIRGQLFGRRR